MAEHKPIQPFPDDPSEPLYCDTCTEDWFTPGGHYIGPVSVVWPCPAVAETGEPQ